MAADGQLGGQIRSMHIRPYKCKIDEASVLAVFDRTFPITHSFLESREQTEGRQHLVFLLGQSETLIAELDGSVIGFITVDDEGYISALYVDRLQIRQGVGSTLLQEVQNYHELLRLHVFEKNVSALEFYRAQGFAVIDEDMQVDSSGHQHGRLEMERGVVK
ncbi:GNAT family N-acetyltransferase [Methylobacterium sp. WL12]|uniref:GNAT family N-acetyltransferase n=1 Tax=Methylobacterium sp. WL12 TaxID=2603890 RepID=UPI0011CA83BF|nr:GNAT family N-acetyltransferase [Methylobacterium sp. WL12]TXM72900.1 GNAT family N-acetyltransferase [Methylobacterium sp. WL12]